MTGLTLRLELRRSRTLLGRGSPSVVLAAYGGLIAAVYPILLTNHGGDRGLHEALPEGFHGGLRDDRKPGRPGHLLHDVHREHCSGRSSRPIAAIVLATRPTGADAERGWADVCLATPLTRRRYLGARSRARW